jgi:hypothetical protein
MPASRGNVNPNCIAPGTPRQGILDSARFAVEAREPWRAVNAAATAWNAYLPLLQAGRFAEALPALLPLLQQILKLPGAAGPSVSAVGAASAVLAVPTATAAAGSAAAAPQQVATAGKACPAPATASAAAVGAAAEARWRVTARLAEAVAKGAEHVALLHLLQSAGATAPNILVDAAISVEASQKGQPPGCCNLGEARQRAGRWEIGCLSLGVFSVAGGFITAPSKGAGSPGPTALCGQSAGPLGAVPLHPSRHTHTQPQQRLAPMRRRALPRRASRRPLQPCCPRRQPRALMRSQLGLGRLYLRPCCRHTRGCSTCAAAARIRSRWRRVPHHRAPWPGRRQAHRALAPRRPALSRSPTRCYLPSRQSAPRPLRRTPRRLPR